MSGYVIVAYAGPYAGWYLKHVGSTTADWTETQGDAIRFPSQDAAFTFWASVPPALGAAFPIQVQELAARKNGDR